MVHTPVHASCLNQVEVYFSIVRRKVLSPNDFVDLDQIKERLDRFAARYNATARPFRWKFTTTGLADLLQCPSDLRRCRQGVRNRDGRRHRLRSRGPGSISATTPRSVSLRSDLPTALWWLLGTSAAEFAHSPEIRNFSSAAGRAGRGWQDVDERHDTS